MTTDTLLLILILGVVLCFALYKESNQGDDSYRRGLPEDSDTRKRIYKKIQYCLMTDQTAIKWRRSFIASILATTVLFGLVHGRFPEPKELILTVLTIYIVYYGSWNHYTSTISSKVAEIGKLHIKRVQSL